jgi:hypothetical protein
MLAISTWLLLRGSAAQITTPATYPADPDQNAAAVDSPRNFVNNECHCDLVRNACDANCCCDESCSEEEKARITACDPSTASPPELNYCLPEAAFAKVLHTNLHCYLLAWTSALHLFADHCLFLAQALASSLSPPAMPLCR